MEKAIGETTSLSVPISDGNSQIVKNRICEEPWSSMDWQDMALKKNLIVASLLEKCVLKLEFFQETNNNWCLFENRIVLDDFKVIKNHNARKKLFVQSV